MNLKKQKRFLAILQGEVPIDEITVKEMKYFQKKVMDAVLANKIADQSKFVFREHRTLQ